MGCILGKPESTDFTRFEGVFSSRSGFVVNLSLLSVTYNSIHIKSLNKIRELK